MKPRNVPTRSTYTTDCMRRVQDKETGEQKIVRFQEERAVSVTLVPVDKAVFWKGARVA